MTSPVQAAMDLYGLTNTRGPGKLQYPDSFLLDNYTLYFSASDGIHGRELWIGDWNDGLYMLKDLNDGPDESAPDNFFKYGGLVFFSTTNSDSFSERGLWMTDGSADGTKLVAPLIFAFPMTFFHFDDEVYFAAEDVDRTMGVELYKLKADLSVELVKDIFEGARGSYPDYFVEFDGKLFFGAGDDVNGRELWVTDGSADGTTLVSDINPGVEESSPGPFVEFEGVLYFATTNADSFTERGLWKTDGTAAGTVFVQSMTFSFPMEFVAVGDSVFFAGSDIDGTEGNELWMFYPAATPSVVGLVKDINPTGDSNPSELTAFNGSLYFAADDSVNGRELWVSDGSEDGTYMLDDINLGSDESSPGPFQEHMGILFFAARSTPDKYDTRSLWMTNGTTEGTEMVVSLYISPDAYFISLEQEMFFAAMENASSPFDTLWLLEGNFTHDDWMGDDKWNMTYGGNRTDGGRNETKLSRPGSNSPPRPSGSHPTMANVGGPVGPCTPGAIACTTAENPPPPAPTSTAEVIKNPPTMVPTYDGVYVVRLPEESDCKVVGSQKNRFSCGKNYPTFPHLDGRLNHEGMTIDFNCAYDEKIGAIVSLSSDCYCFASWIAKTIVGEERVANNIFGARAGVDYSPPKVCMCSACPSGSKATIAVDCGTYDDVFYKEDCNELQCDGQLANCANNASLAIGSAMTSDSFSQMNKQSTMTTVYLTLVVSIIFVMI